MRFRPTIYHIGIVQPLEPRRLLSTVFGSAFVDATANGTATDGQPLPGGVVYADLNFDGVRNAGEPGATNSPINGWQLTLDPGTYLLRLEPPAGYHTTYPAEQARSVTVRSGFNIIGIKFGAWGAARYGRLFYADRDGNGQFSTSVDWSTDGRTIWADLDNDGLMDPHEPAGGADASGFAGVSVRPGTYTFRFTKPPEWTFTNPTSGSAQATVRWGIGSILPPVGAHGATVVQGVAFDDPNGDRRMGAGESPRAGVTVFVDANRNGRPDAGERSVQTEATGRFVLAGPSSAGAPVTVQDPLGGGPLAGVSGYPGADSEISLFAGVRPHAAVSGLIYADLNNNGLRDGNDLDLPGRLVYVDLDDDAVADAGEPSTRTDAAGQFSLNAPAGLRRVRTVESDGYVFGPAGGAFAPVQVSGRNTYFLGDLAVTDTGPAVAGSVMAGYSFHDENRNGRRDPGEAGNPGRTVWADADSDGVQDATERSAVTDDAGFFAITRLPGNEDYLLREVVPAGWEPVWVGNNGVNFAIFDSSPSAFELNAASRPAPAVQVAAAAFEPAAQRVSLRFNRDVSTTLGAADVVLRDAGTGQYLPPTSWQLEQSLEGGAGGVTAAVVRFAAALPRGNYQLILRRGAVTDVAGNVLPADYVLDFFVLAGDVNRDRFVNGSDFALLAANFGRTGMTYDKGDLNGDGSVNGTDFAILAGNFGRSLPAAQAAPAAAEEARVTARVTPPPRRVQQVRRRRVAKPAGSAVVTPHVTV